MLFVSYLFSQYIIVFAFKGPQDGQKESMEGEDITVTITQTNIITENIPTLDKNYTLTLTTYGGLQKGTRLFTGFLQQKDVSRNFQVNLPYISNPNSTMDQTSRVIARRFIAIGGPSFYVSFLGQDSLNGQLNINVTFDSSIDWSNGQPVLAYWDIGTCIKILLMIYSSIRCQLVERSH